MSKHGISNLEEASNVGTCLQVRVVLLGSLHPAAVHTSHITLLAGIIKLS